MCAVEVGFATRETVARHPEKCGDSSVPSTGTGRVMETGTERREEKNERDVGGRLEGGDVLIARTTAV